jgi:DNA-directed RNA polymerase subunit RPC12/RpoP
MAIETIGEALAAGWLVSARCVKGREDGPGSRSSRECIYRHELELETLVVTRGRAFPIASLESRLRCPRCGNRRMRVMFEPPTTPRAIAR